MAKPLSAQSIKKLIDNLDAADLKQARSISEKRAVFLDSQGLSKIRDWRDAKWSIEIERLLRGKGAAEQLPKDDAQNSAKIDALIADAEKRAGGDDKTCH